MSSLEPLDKLQLITKDLEEVIGTDSIKHILDEGKDLKIYWGTATTGKPHLGYFLPIFKLADFLDAGCHVKILFANLHGFLDNMKSDWSLLEYRAQYYEIVIKEMLSLIGVSTNRLEFVKGTDFQLKPEYTMDVYKTCALIDIEEAKKAGSEVVKQSESPLLSNLIYPILQALDEEYLDVDVQFGGIDQRKIFMFSRDHMNKLGYRKRGYFMNPLIPGLGESGKMSSSEPNSKIDFDDSDKMVRRKIGKAYSVDGVIKDNGILAIVRYIIFKFLSREDKPFVVQKPERHGGERYEYTSYWDLENAFKDGIICSADLKPTVANYILEFLKGLRDRLKQDDMIELEKNAYPSVIRKGKGKANKS